MRILKTENKKDNKFLRKQAEEFDFGSAKKSELRSLIQDMRKAMHDANGVGLAASQIGINKRFFVAEFDGKFYAMFNPEIVKTSEIKESVEEGCLSIPGEYGEVSRFSEVTVKALDRNGKRVKMRAWGHLARIFQHEVDHLDGKLFTDYKK